MSLMDGLLSRYQQRGGSSEVGKMSRIAILRAKRDALVSFRPSSSTSTSTTKRLVLSYKNNLSCGLGSGKSVRLTDKFYFS